ncbi:protein containing DUF1621 [mine drainage metagenome]|uniref:Protein containing DUF1621 n=2 Tax=mine drainage metagenome TaxID=410659 RepID=T0ZN50_9ZZZZ
MFRKPILRRHQDDTLEDGSFLDLGAMHFEDEASAMNAAKATVRVAEIFRFEELHALSKYAYQGDIVLLDYTSLSNDQVAVNRLNSELKNVVRDTGGDVAGVSKNLLALTPAGIKVDRHKLRPEGL